MDLFAVMVARMVERRVARMPRGIWMMIVGVGLIMLLRHDWGATWISFLHSWLLRSALLFPLRSPFW